MESNLNVVLLAAILPAFFLVIYIWLRDQYQREPISQIIRGVLLGVLSAAVAMALEMAISTLGLAPDDPQSFLGAAWKAFVGAAIPEELAKLWMLWLLLRHNKYFDERFDGIAYAVCVGMGFAGTENIIYLFDNLNDWQGIAFQRAIFAVPGHFMFAVAMGYMYSMIYFGDMSWRKRSRVLWVPVLLHGIYDSLLFMVDVGTPLSAILIVTFYVFCFVMFRGGRRRINDQLKRDRQDPNQIAHWK